MPNGQVVEYFLPFRAGRRIQDFISESVKLTQITSDSSTLQSWTVFRGESKRMEFTNTLQLNEILIFDFFEDNARPFWW